MVKKRDNFVFLSVSILALTLILISLIFAEHAVTTTTGEANILGPTSFNINEDLNLTFNITINNTDPGQAANITQVNITLWGNFNFIAGTNGTSVSPNVSFINTTTDLSWTNTTDFVINGSVNNTFFWFNASAFTPGVYNITVSTRNITGVYSTNISVTVNDTTAPSAVAITYPVNGTNYSAMSVINYTVVDNGALSRCWYSNSTGVWNSSSVAAGTNFSSVVTKEGSNNFTVYCNDTGGNLNQSSAIVFNKDSILPSSVTIVYPTNTTYGVNVSEINYTVVDSGVLSRCWYSNSSSAIWNSTSQVPGTNFTSVITTELSNIFTVYCNDSAGNINSSSVTFIKDTTAPSAIQLVSPTPAHNSIAIYGIPVNITVTENFNVSTIRIYLFNTTGLVNNTNVSSSSAFLNYTGLPSGTYYINMTVNDSLGNVNSTSENRTIILSSNAFLFNGTVKDENGTNLNNANITVTIKNMNTWATVSTISTTTNSSGWFNVNIPLTGANQQSWMTWIYEPAITHTNSTLNYIDFKSKTIPAFPYMMVQQLAGSTFYLTPAGTINITAVNSTGQRTNFKYQVKDTKLGYPIAEDMTTSASQVVIYVPRNRNYSIMIYPDQSMPVSFNWNNFSSAASYNFSSNLSQYGISSYNATSYTLHKQFNTTMTMVRVSGWVNVSGLNWTNLTVVPFLLEGGNMVHSQFGAMPYNLSAFSGNNNIADVHNLASGFFNISLPATVESSTIILFATGLANDSKIYGGFKNISLGYTTAPLETNNTNFSKMYKLFGNSANISMDNTAGGKINITTAKQRFELINSTNFTIGNTSAHVEVKVDYSSYGAMEFTWMADIAQSSVTSFFEVPLINITGIKEINVFASGGGGSGDNSQYAPKRTSFTAAQIAANETTNITIGKFNPGGINTSISSGSITIGMYISNSTCDVPIPPSACSLGSSEAMSMDPNAANSFNPMQAVMGGGRISFRMGTGDITVHYVNVDMLASGPPDALFDSSTSNSTSANSFDAAVRFGSGGPTIYDYVLVSMPYIEGSSSVSGLNESADVNMNIPDFYDDNWNIIWNISMNGTSPANFAGNYSHYSTHSSEWGTLMNQTNCTRNASQLNSTIPCYIDTANNKIWIRLPHFSGTGPKVTGNSVIAAVATVTPGTGSSSGTSFWINTQSVTEKQFTDGYTVSLNKKYRLQFTVDKKIHYVGVVDLTSTTATINVSSKSFQAVFNIGDEKKFEVTNDSYYDISVKLNSISNNKASITIKRVNETITSAAPPTTPSTTTPPAETTDITAPPAKKYGVTQIISNNILMIVLIIIIIVIIALYIIFSKKSKKIRHERIKVYDF